MAEQGGAMGSDHLIQGEPVPHELDDLWKMADQGPKAIGVMSFEEMDAAKARRAW
jgi:hypothetical protein